MKGLVAWFAGNSVAANLVMVLVLVGGALTARSIKTELFPEFSLDMIQVSVVYPGAAPEEIEESVCVRIEEEVHSIDGVDRVRSTASEGMGVVTIEVQSGEDPRRVLDDVKTRVDAIETLPEQAEKPVIQELLMRQQVVYVAVSGAADRRTLKRLGEEVRDGISALDGVSQVELTSTRPYEVSIEVSEEDLQRHGLSFDRVADAVRRGSVDLSGGSVRSRAGEVLLRTDTQAYRGPDFERIVLMTRPDGSRLLLSDVATVVDGFAETDQDSRFNGDATVLVQAFRVGQENALDVSARVHEYVERRRAGMPAGVDLTIWGDAAPLLQSRLDLLVKNGLQGLALVFLILALFLRFRLAFWVTLGIPISFMGALWVMPALGLSINMLSLFAFIVVLGIVVDDAIVVGESIFSEQQEGRGGVAGAVAGAQRVAVPVTFAILTTVVAFVPLAELPGMMGKFFRVIPLVVIPCLLFSWIESKIVLPAHLAHSARWVDRLAQVAPFRWWVAFQGLFERGMTWWARHVYRPSLDVLLRWRYLTVAFALSTLLLVVGLVGGGFVEFSFFNPIEADIVAVRLEMPLGTPASVTAEAVERIERAAQRLREELDAERAEGEPSVVKNFLASIGDQPYRAQQNRGFGTNESFAQAHLGEVVMELVPAEQREIRSSEVVRRWRELTGPIPGAIDLAFSADLMAAGEDVEVQFAGDDMDELAAAARELRAGLAGYAGVYDEADTFRGGKQELSLDVLPAGRSLGITRADLARQVRQAFYGEEAQRIQRGKNDVKVMVRYPERARESLHTLELMRIRTPDGAEVPFTTVASAELGRGFSTITRADRKRTVNVTANVDEAVANSNDVVAAIVADDLPAILERHPGVSYTFEGENRQQAETIGAMVSLFLLALFAIYALMAVPFRSYAQPLIVMTAIPFGLVGAVVGHMIMGIELSVLSLCGIVALSGVVVNDSLVLVDFVNRRVAEGRPILEAARVAGVERFRPILLTSLTTFAGLTPLILEKSVQAQFLVPMAISLAYGVIFSTAISLVIVPAGYLILEDLRVLGAKLFGLRAESVHAGEAGSAA